MPKLVCRSTATVWEARSTSTWSVKSQNAMRCTCSAVVEQGAVTLNSWWIHWAQVAEDEYERLDRNKLSATGCTVSWSHETLANLFLGFSQHSMMFDRLKGEPRGTGEGPSESSAESSIVSSSS